MQVVPLAGKSLNELSEEPLTVSSITALMTAVVIHYAVIVPKLTLPVPLAGLLRGSCASYEWIWSAQRYNQRPSVSRGH